MLNVDAPWEKFNSNAYRDHNYGSLRDDDKTIIERTRDFFSESGVFGGRGIDVGTGANLYPAMAMLPFCARLDLQDRACTNVTWLSEEVGDYDNSWDQFWAVYQGSSSYRRILDPRSALARSASVGEADVFSLPPATWDIGTMFFVACSISDDVGEFDRAVRQFVRSLRSGAPFAAAFMLGSKGYKVDGIDFPAVSLTQTDVSETLESVAYDVSTHDIPTKNPVRKGYEGMLLATGRAGQST